MKNIYFLILLPLFLVFSARVSAQAWQWGRQGTGVPIEGWAVATDASGNVYGAGFINEPSSPPVSFGSYNVPAYTNSDQYQSVWVKYNAAGTALWAGGTVSGATCIQNITTDPGGNLLILGSFTSATMQVGSITLTSAYIDGSAQYFLAKLSPSGSVLWAINDGNTVPELDAVYGILGPGNLTTDDTGNIYITSAFKKRTMSIGGHTFVNADATGSTYDVFVAKYSPAGTLLWASSFGGTKDDFAFGIAVNDSGKVYVAGAYWSPHITVGSSTIIDTFTSSMAYIAKLSSSGAPLWAQGVEGGSQAYASGLVKDNSGNIYMTGSFVDSTISFGRHSVTRLFPANSDAPATFIAQYSPADTVTWAHIVESAFYQVMSFSISYSPCAQQVWIAGNYYGDALMARTDTIRSLSGPDPAFLAGYTTAGAIAGHASISSGADDGIDIACDATGNVYLCADFMPGTLFTVGPDTLTSIGSEETFYLAKYRNVTTPPDTTYATVDTSAPCSISGTTLRAPAGYGTYIWDDNSTGATRVIDTSGTYFVWCGTCTNWLRQTMNVTVVPDTTFTRNDTVACALSDGYAITLTAPPGTNYVWYDDSTSATHMEFYPGTYWVSFLTGCNFTTDTFHVTFTQSSPPCTVGINSPPQQKDVIDFFPNPASDQLTVQVNYGNYNSCTISNDIGQVYLSLPLSAAARIDIQRLPPGLYYLTCGGPAGSVVRKFVKE